MTTPNSPDVASNSVTPPSKARQVALGCGIIFIGMAVVLALLIKVFGKHRQSDDGTDQSAPAAAAAPALRIIATVDQFKETIPLLRRLPMDTVTRDGATEYGWRDVSTTY